MQDIKLRKFALHRECIYILVDSVRRRIYVIVFTSHILLPLFKIDKTQSAAKFRKITVLVTQICTLLLSCCVIFLIFNSYYLCTSEQELQQCEIEQCRPKMFGQYCLSKPVSCPGFLSPPSVVPYSFLVVVRYEKNKWLEIELFQHIEPGLSVFYSTVLKVMVILFVMS